MLKILDENPSANKIIELGKVDDLAGACILVQYSEHFAGQFAEVPPYKCGKIVGVRCGVGVAPHLLSDLSKKEEAVGINGSGKPCYGE